MGISGNFFQEIEKLDRSVYLGVSQRLVAAGALANLHEQEGEQTVDHRVDQRANLGGSVVTTHGDHVSEQGLDDAIGDGVGNDEIEAGGPKRILDLRVHF